MECLNKIPTQPQDLCFASPWTSGPPDHPLADNWKCRSCTAGDEELPQLWYFPVCLNFHIYFSKLCPSIKS